MIRLLLPVLLVAFAYGYWKFLATATGELRKRRVQTAVTWGVFLLTLFAAARSGSLLWLIGTAVVMVVMRVVAHTGRQSSETFPKDGKKNAGPETRARHREGMSRIEALAVFELGEDATSDVIQKRYRELMRTVHPDRGGSNYLASKLNEAYAVLMAEQRR